MSYQRIVFVVRGSYVPRTAYTPSPELSATFDAVDAAMRRYGIDTSTYTGTHIPKDYTLYVAIGGDGSCLTAARLSTETPNSAFVGIHAGRVGFLTSTAGVDQRVDLVQLCEWLKDTVMYGSSDQIKRAALSVNGTNIALNDVVIGATQADAMIEYSITVDGIDAGTHRANSVIVSTPTGSTAYSLSAGGALILPEVNVMQIVPVAPYTLTSRPLIVCGNSTITIRTTNPSNARVLCDGISSVVDAELTTISMGAKAATSIVYPGSTFFNVLRNKLGWNTK